MKRGGSPQVSPFMLSQKLPLMKKRFLGLILTFIPLSLSFGQDGYTPNKLLRQTIRQEVWQELKPQTPQKYQFLMGLIFKGDEYFKSYRKVAHSKGLPPEKLATVETFFTILCEEVVQGKEVADSEVANRYRATQTKFEETQKDYALSDQEKQRKYDPLILKAMWIAQLFDAEKKNKVPIQVLAQNLLDQYTPTKLNPSPQTSVRPSSTPTQEANPSKQAESTPSTLPSPSSPTSSSSYTHEIEDIILRTVTSYGLSGMYVTNEVNILFKNGDVYTNPSIPLSQLNVAQSKREKPTKWDTWEKRGNIIYVKRSKNGKVYDWKKWFPVRSAANGHRIQGRYACADGFGGAVVINASLVSFDKQGRFAWKTVKGGNTSWKPIYSKSESAGTYSIEGHVITLEYNNGAKESFFFGLYPKDNQHFIIGSSHFTPADR